jgi:hypothetical protein
LNLSWLVTTPMLAMTVLGCCNAPPLN